MKDFLRNNGVLILIIAVLLTLIVAVTSTLMGGVADPLSNLVGIVTTPVRNGVNAVANWTEEQYQRLFLQDQMQAEYEQLKRDYAKLEEQLREAESDAEENERLRNLLGLREKRRDFVFESGYGHLPRLLQLGFRPHAQQGQLCGRRGRKNCVVDEYGNLVGIIDEVGVNWSQVMTVVDSDLEMGGLIARTDSAGILEGQFDLMGEGKLKLSYLPENSEFMAGDQVLTSGLSGAYPSGLVVGHVEEVLTDASGMTPLCGHRAEDRPQCAAAGLCHQEL